MSKKKGCYIDNKGIFRFDEKEMATWFNQAMLEVDAFQPETQDIPFMVFLMGCEASLRCQEKETIH